MPDRIETTANIDEGAFRPIDGERLYDAPRGAHPPRILLLYGSVRQRSYSRLATEEAASILRRFGAETRTFNPSGLPLPDDAEEGPPQGPRTQRAGRLVRGDGLVFPRAPWRNERIMKAQIDWIPLTLGAVRLTQGKTLALMQVSGGSQSFNALNQLRILGRWMRMFTFPTNPRWRRRFSNSRKMVG